MKKNVFFAAVALVALAGCTNDERIGGEVISPDNPQAEQGAIVFSSGAYAITRADLTGSDAAAKLNNNFVVEGFKWNGNNDTKVTVFDHYNVNYVANTANTTTSNTHNWEYVAQTKHGHATISAQSIKYWDYAVSQYDFIAYSAGTATAITTGTPTDGQVLISKIDASKMNGVKTEDVYTGGAYTIEGKADDLAKTYIADMVTAYRDPIETTDYNKTVQFKFRSLSAKVRMALYETVPGYSVKDVVFYTAENTAATDGKAHLYTTGSDVFNGAGKYIVYFPTTGSANKEDPDYNRAHLAFEAATTDGTSTTKDFGSLDLTNKGAEKEVAEAGGKVYLGRSSNTATFAGTNTTENPNYYTVVIPNETGATLNLKVNYTLVSTDGSGETINVTGATARVPAIYASWKSGYAYTYLFKISQNTNGVTNPDAGPAGLYPITFDAVVTEAEDGVQETITTVAEPSITTYAKGTMVTAKDEYLTGANIYVTVKGTPETLTVGTNANLYTVTLEEDAAQTINEASVANAIKNGGSTSPYTVTDANGKKMVITNATGLTAVTEIAAADAPDGNAITVNGAKFTPTTAGIYVFEYIQAATYVAATGTYVAGITYYTDNTGATTVDTSSFEAGVTDVSSYFVVATPVKKHYKIIKVVAAP